MQAFNWTVGKRFESTPERLSALVGLLPDFWSAADPRTAKEQADENYAHGGGWFPMKGWQLSEDKDTLIYPGEDPEYYPLVCKLELPLTQETICIFTHAWVAIVQSNGDFEVARMD